MNNELILQKLNQLSQSKFRNSFHLRKYMYPYIEEKGMDTISRHAYDFIINRLADAYPVNDGKQTPTKGHPIFIAQHACACCCRGCLEKWHRIPKGRKLNNQEIEYIHSILMAWISLELKK